MVERELLELFKELSRIEGLSQKEKPVAQIIFNYLNDIGLSPKYDESQKFTGSDTDNIICEFNGGGEILLLSHMDTARSTKGLVHVEHSDKITSDGDTVLGVDNRVGNAVLLFMTSKVIREKIPTKGFTIAFTTCEETTLAGSKYLGINENIRRAFVFDSYLRPGNFICTSLGAVSFIIRIFGKASHAGIAPEQGISAIKIASEAIANITTGTIEDSTTLNFGKINGGSAVNVIPEEVVVEGEIRSFEKEKINSTIDSIINTFERIANQYGGNIEFISNWDFKPYSVKKEELVYKEITKAIHGIGLTANAVLSNGGSDANSLNERGIPSINIGIGAQNPHSNEEFILYQDLQNSYNIALKLVESDGK